MKQFCGVKPQLAQDRDPLTKAPPAPKWMTKEAQTEWKRVMPRLIEDRIITRADLHGVEDYCIATGRIRELEAILATGFDPKLFSAQNRAMQTARLLAAEFGLSPMSRTRISSGAADEEEGFL